MVMTGQRGGGPEMETGIAERGRAKEQLQEGGKRLGFKLGGSRTLG